MIAFLLLGWPLSILVIATWVYCATRRTVRWEDMVACGRIGLDHVESRIASDNPVDDARLRWKRQDEAQLAYRCVDRLSRMKGGINAASKWSVAVSSLRARIDSARSAHREAQR